MNPPARREVVHMSGKKQSNIIHDHENVYGYSHAHRGCSVSLQHVTTGEVEKKLHGKRLALEDQLVNIQHCSYKKARVPKASRRDPYPASGRSTSQAVCDFAFQQNYIEIYLI